MVDNLLSQNEQLQLDDRVREIVEILLLSRNYYNRDVNRASVLSKLKRIAANSKYTKNKLIASNYIVELVAMQYGSSAPDFDLVDANNDTITLDSLVGKFVLLSFIKDDCKICKYHMQLVNDIRTQTSNKFEIVTIFSGEKINKIVQFANERDYDLSILDAGNEVILFEDYNIVAYPSYVFINPDGTIANAYLPMPDENMEFHIRRLMERYSNKQ